MFHRYFADPNSDDHTHIFGWLLLAQVYGLWVVLNAKDFMRCHQPKIVGEHGPAVTADVQGDWLFFLVHYVVEHQHPVREKVEVEDVPAWAVSVPLVGVRRDVD